MAILGSTGINGFLASAKATLKKHADGTRVYIEDFLSGFGGHGWKIWKRGENWRLEIDELMVRKTMTIFELLIHKIRAVKGALAITQASGKVKSVSLEGGIYELEIEDEMSFAEGDIVRCQRWENGQSIYYHVPISRVLSTSIEIDESSFTEGMSHPQEGDELIQFGNTKDKSRQSAIYLHADEGGEPAIDVMFGINSTDWSNKTKIRLGGNLPNSESKGFYCENGMIVSRDSNGDILYQLNPDGSGSLAREKIVWKANGELTINMGETKAFEDLKNEFEREIDNIHTEIGDIEEYNSQLKMTLNELSSIYTSKDELENAKQTILTQTAQSIQAEAKKIEDGVAVKVAELSVNPDSIIAEVKSEYSQAGMAINGNGTIDFTAGKINVRNPLDEDTDNPYMQVAADAEGFPHIYLYDKSGARSLDISYKGITQLIQQTTKASMLFMGMLFEELPSGSKMLSKEVTPSDFIQPSGGSVYSKSGLESQTNKTKAYQFLAEHSGNIIPDNGVTYDQHYFTGTSVDETNNQPTTISYAPNGIYICNMTQEWIDKSSNMSARAKTNSATAEYVKYVEFINLTNNENSNIAILSYSLSICKNDKEGDSYYFLDSKGNDKVKETLAILMRDA